MTIDYRQRAIDQTAAFVEKLKQQKAERKAAEAGPAPLHWRNLGYTCKFLLAMAPDMKEGVDRAASCDGVSKSEWVRRAIQKALTETP